MKTKQQKMENKQRLEELEKKFQDYRTDFIFLQIQKETLENRIINLQNKVSNLENFNE
jgi:uncharacterized coiled-coil protein SlyX